MPHLQALASTLALTTAVVVTGVAAGATTTPADHRTDLVANTSAAFVATVPAHGFFWQLTAPQKVLAGTLLMTRKSTHRHTRGTRSDRQFFKISSSGSNDVPEAALRAYHHAEKVMATEDPGCHISWTMLAAIGRVESDHGRFGGAQLGSDGVSRPEIRGPRLDGAGPFAAIQDTDRGTLDHDKAWDRAVGQMQFLPGTWLSVARDGDGDGVRNPDDIDDSALGSAVYLCGAGGSLADSAGMARAALRYNHSDYYVQLVLSFQSGYETGVFSIPSPPPPAGAEKGSPKSDRALTPKPVTGSRKHRSSSAHQGKLTDQPTSDPTTPPRPSHAPLPTPTSSPKPTPKPTPKPSPKPSPTPSGPQLVAVAGPWTACGGGFCLEGTQLDLGAPSSRGEHAGADFDGDGTVETNGEEFDGLSGSQVNLQVERVAGRYLVYVIGGHGYRNADGSPARSFADPTPAP